MPIAVIHILEGRSQEKKEKMIKNVTKGIVDSLDVPDENVRIIINEMKPQNYSVAGLPIEQYRQSKKK